MGAFTETGGGILLAIAAQPIHEGGHAVATRVLTGAWPHLGFWAVYPVSLFSSKLDALIVLAAGDSAVLAWWTVLFLVVRCRSRYKWALVGPTFMVAIVLLNWLAAAALFPFGYYDVGASDAAKFLAISGFAPWCVTVAVIALAAVISTASANYFGRIVLGKPLNSTET